MSNEDESAVDRLIESAYMADHRRKVTAEDEAMYWMGEADDARRTAIERWSTIVRLRHDQTIYRWTIVVLVISNLIAYRAWEWVR